MTTATDHPFAPILNAARKVVFSRTLKTADWANTTIAAGDTTEEIDKLRRGCDGHIVVWGGVRLWRSLMRLDLIDELQLSLFPYVAGEGTRLFERRPQVLPARPGLPPAISRASCTPATASTSPLPRPVVARLRRTSPWLPGITSTSTRSARCASTANKCSSRRRTTRSCPDTPMSLASLPPCDVQPRSVRSAGCAHLPAVVIGPPLGVSDVALRAFELRRGRVILSDV